jgi:hypothetical protein
MNLARATCVLTALTLLGACTYSPPGVVECSLLRDRWDASKTASLPPAESAKRLLAMRPAHDRFVADCATGQVAPKDVECLRKAMDDGHFSVCEVGMANDLLSDIVDQANGKR